MAEKKAHSADLSVLRINRDAEHGQGNSSSKNKTMGLISLVVIVLVCIIYVFTKNTNSSPSLSTAEVTMVYPSQSDATLTASGYVVAQRQAAVASKGTGRLEFLGVEEGDEVKTGQIIAQLEHDDVDAALEQSRANLEMAKATLKQHEADLNEAKLHHDRQKNLVEKGLISQSEYDIAEARFKSAEAAVAAAQAQIELSQAVLVSAEVDVENTRIRAPFDGTVLTKNADIGEMVAPFAASSNSRGAVVTIADMNSLEVEADVSESNIQRVRLGQACEIILDAFPSQRYPGFVHKIVPTADRAKATVLTKIRFKERDEKVLPEMSAKVHFLSSSDDSDGSMKPLVAIPKNALTKRDDRQVVFVVRGKSVTETPVAIGREFPGKIEIVSGLSVGERVVINPTDDLKTGATIKIE